MLVGIYFRFGSHYISFCTKKSTIGRCKGLLPMSKNLLIIVGCEIKYLNSRASVSQNMWKVTKFLP